MAHKPADVDGLTLIIAALAFAPDLQVSDANWSKIPRSAAKTLKEALNPGINPKKVKLRTLQHSSPDDGSKITYVVAAYDDVDADFWARYIVSGDWLIAAYEN